MSTATASGNTISSSSVKIRNIFSTSATRFSAKTFSGKAIGELRAAQRKIGLGNKISLTDLEMAHVAIAYNTGGLIPSRGLKQGFKDDSGRFYGELIFDFILKSRTVPLPRGVPSIPAPPAGNAIMAAAMPVTATGPSFVVNTREAPLRLRSWPRISRPAGENVIVHLPDGHAVRAVTGRKKNGFIEIETDLFGAHVRGFASAKFLTRSSPRAVARAEAVAAEAPLTGIVAVTMPRRPGTVTKRTELADAHSLNEPNQPGRKGTAPIELVRERTPSLGGSTVGKVDA